MHHIPFQEDVKGDTHLSLDTPEDGLIRQERKKAIDSFLNQLEPAYRQMAFLRFYERKSFSQSGGVRFLDIYSWRV